MGNQVCTILLLTGTAVEQRREDGNRCITFCVLLWMLQNTPHEVYVYIGCAPKLYLCEDLCFIWCRYSKKKQDACYCEFYRAVNFVVHDTVTIPYLTAVRNTVAN